MATSMIKPDVAFDGVEFSGMTRLLDALNGVKEFGFDKESMDKAQEARFALQENAPVSVEDLKALIDGAKKYKKAQEDKKLSPTGASVKGFELDHLIEKLEGLEKIEETKDKDGNKVHPAALPAGDDHAKDKDEKGAGQPLPKEKNDVPAMKAEGEKAPASKKDEAKK